MILTRRKFIATALTLTAAPAIVRVSSIMSVRAVPVEWKLLVWDYGSECYVTLPADEGVCTYHVGDHRVYHSGNINDPKIYQEEWSDE